MHIRVTIRPGNGRDDGQRVLETQNILTDFEEQELFAVRPSTLHPEGVYNYDAMLRYERARENQRRTVDVLAAVIARELHKAIDKEFTRG